MIAWGFRVRVPIRRRNEAARILRSLPGPARVRPGCLNCHLYQDIEDPATLALVQEWESWDDLERYLRSEDYPKLLAVVELAVEQPAIWFDTIEIRDGMERLAAGQAGGTLFERPYRRERAGRVSDRS